MKNRKANLWTALDLLAFCKLKSRIPRRLLFAGLLGVISGIIANAHSFISKPNNKRKTMKTKSIPNARPLCHLLVFNSPINGASPLKSDSDVPDIVSLVQQPWMKKLLFVTVFASLLSDSALGQTNVIADSVADYSITQGYKNWYYGYCVGSYAQNAFSQFTANFNCCGLGDAWATSQNVWTAMWRWGGTPNGLDGNGGHDKVLQVAVRRWVSTTEGNVTIAGNTSSCDAPGVTCNGGGYYCRNLCGWDNGFFTTCHAECPHPVLG
jgi:hypothetical protein